MDAGKLDRRVSFKRPVLSDDGYTSGVSTLEDYCDRWASYKPVNGREIFENQGREARAGGSFWVRSDSETRAIDETFVLEFEENNHDIVSINPLDRNGFIEIVAVRSDRG